MRDHFEGIAVPPRPRFALWDTAFRPFFLLASVFAALSVPLWALQFSGLLGRSYFSAPIWHAHEMLFGFVVAVIVGFLFTAGRNWTGGKTPSGWLLAALAAWWIAGRLLVMTSFGWAAAAVNVAFPLLAAIGLAVPLYRAGNRRNYFFVVLLIAMSVASAVVHLVQLGLVVTKQRLRREVTWHAQRRPKMDLSIETTLAGCLQQAIQKFAQGIKSLTLLHDPTVANIGAANPALNDVVEAFVDHIAADSQGGHERRSGSP